MLTFSRAEEKYESLILEWLHKPHVNEWYHGQGLQNTIEGLRRFVTGNQPRFDAWIAFCDGKPFGYLMTSVVEENEAHSDSQYAKWVEPGKKMYTLDLLIGDTEFLGKGLSTPMIKQFIQEILSDADIVFIDPEASNEKAIHVYERAGFEKLEQFVASWHPVSHWLMKLNAKNSKQLVDPQTIRTERLILRQWQKSDFAPFAELNADPTVREFFPSILNSAESDALAEQIECLINEKGWGFWAVSCPGVSDFIGMIGLERVNFDAPFTPAVEIGWRLARPYWGKGYATEGAKAALRFAFEELGLNEVVAFTTMENMRSRSVMEKLGMTHDPNDDFDHPKVPEGHSLQRHVLYRISRKQFDEGLDE